MKLFGGRELTYCELHAVSFLTPLWERRQWWGFLSHEKGQALIEFAFVVPLLFLFILIVVDFGIALDRRELTQHAVREGARRAAVGATVAEVKDATHNQSGGTLGADDVKVCFVDRNSNGIPDRRDNVRVSGEYTLSFRVCGWEMV